jgi:hypothetical protein
MTMTRLVLIAAVLVLALASNAAAGVNGAIGANWNTPGTVAVTVVSSHSFHGNVETTCVATAGTNTDATQALTGWVYNEAAHGYEIHTSFNIAAAGSGAHCTISLLDGRKLLDQLQFTSV